VEGRSLPRVLYIGGMGRSGSTLLERLLGQLPGVCSVGEAVYVWKRGVVEGNRCGCGEPFRLCPFWNEVADVAFGGWDNVDVARVVELAAAVDRTRFIPLLLAPALRPALHRRLEQYVAYYATLYSAIGVVSGREVIVDSSKNASFAFCLRWCPGLDLRVIHIVRDSRAVAYSWTRKVIRPEAPTPRYLATHAPASAAWRWNYQNGAFQLLAGIGTPTLRVRYEDLVAAPAATIARLAAFAGLSANTNELDFIDGEGSSQSADLDVAHTASGNPMRFAAGRIPIRVDDEWRTAMSGVQRRTVAALTLPLLTHYGYLRSGFAA
jgi:hypothetical protein